MAEIASRALDALDVGVIIYSEDLKKVLLKNHLLPTLIGESPPSLFMEAVRLFVQSRKDTRRTPPSMRIEINDKTLYVRVVPSEAPPPLEIVFVREEILRDVDVFRLLNARHGISRREYQIITALRLGKTNRQIAADLGIAEGTVGRHVHKLLERMDAPNRTRLVDLVEQMIHRKT